MNPIPEWIDEHQAGAIVGMSARYLQELRRKGGGPEFVKFGRSVRYHRDVVRAWAATRSRKSTSQAAVAPHTNGSGEPSALLTWTGTCIRCGDAFEHVTGRRAPRYLNRTCRPCRVAPTDAERVDAMVDVSPNAVIRDDGGAE